MKRIRKSGEPTAFRDWKRTLKPRDPIPSWNRDFPAEPKAALRIVLSDDQKHLCCYCTATIANGAFHIEHFRPRETYRHLTYEWKNLLASCESYGFDSFEGSIIETQRHCGRAKENWFDEQLMIDPQIRQPERLFRYPLDGRIAPEKRLASDIYKAADETIKKLNLNAPSLVARRRSLLQLAADDASAMTNETWRARYLTIGRYKALQEFWPALSYNYSKHWSKILA